jgi:hypothetical protein
MKTYYLLLEDPTSDNAFGIAKGPDNLEPVDWIQGKKLSPGPAPQLLTLHEASGTSDKLADIGAGLYTVFSPRLRNVLTAAGVDNIDYFPARLELPGTGSHWDDYFLVNILGLIRAVAGPAGAHPSGRRSLAGMLTHFTIDEQRAAGVPLFRLAESPDLIVIDEPVKAKIEAANLDGIYIQPTQEWSGVNNGAYQ